VAGAAVALIERTVATITTRTMIAGTTIPLTTR
jgi:hypothetical protein